MDDSSTPRPSTSTVDASRTPAVIPRAIVDLALRRAGISGGLAELPALLSLLPIPGLSKNREIRKLARELAREGNECRVSISAGSIAWDVVIR